MKEIIARTFSILFLLSLPCSLLAQSGAEFIEKPFQSLFTSQLSVCAGATRLAHSGEHLTGLSMSMKEVYAATGVLYLNAGIAYSWLQGVHDVRMVNDMPQRARVRASTMSVPIGGGFCMGDDRGLFFTGIDLLPSCYFAASQEVASLRRLTIGFSPEVGFLIKVGRQRQRGVYFGMCGKWQWVPPAMKNDGYNPLYNFAGVGLTLRF